MRPGMVEEKLAMRFARELTAKAGAVDRDILRDLTATFTSPEIVELTMSICLFNVFNRFNDVPGSEIDLDLAPLELYPRPLPASKISM
jgi:alkylhydroperoxidase family enzyme